MTVVLVLIIGLIAFLLGYTAGFSKKDLKAEPDNIKRLDSEIVKLMEEYRNFLNYNGDEQ